MESLATRNGQRIRAVLAVFEQIWAFKVLNVIELQNIESESIVH